MTRDEIIRIAREASGGTTWWPLHTDTLERFAALVAAAKREACARLCESNHELIADSLDGYDIAVAIRARGKP